MTKNFRMMTPIGLGLMASIALGFAVNSVTSSGISSASGIAGLLASGVSLTATLWSLLQATLSRNLIVESSKLIQYTQRIEDLAHECVQHSLTAKPARSFFEVRAALVDREIFRAADLETFDDLMRVRNGCVHGDLEDIDETDLRSAQEGARQLLLLLLQAQRNYGQSSNPEFVEGNSSLPVAEDV